MAASASAYFILELLRIFLIGGLAIRRVVVDFHAIRGGHLIGFMQWLCDSEA